MYETSYAVIDKTRGKGGAVCRAFVLDALGGLATAVDQCSAAVATGMNIS